MNKQEIYNIFTVGTEFIPPKTAYYAKLGRTLRDIRAEHQITVQQIQQKTGISADVLCKYENGMRDIPIYDLLTILSFIESTNLFDVCAI